MPVEIKNVATYCLSCEQADRLGNDPGFRRWFEGLYTAEEECALAAHIQGTCSVCQRHEARGY